MRPATQETHFWRGRRVLVTGANGFIGSHLVRALRPFSPHLISLTRRDANVRDAGRVEAFFDEIRPQIVFHLAGTRGAAGADAARNAVECAAVNILGTAHVLAAALRFGVERVVMMGSAAEYGAQPGPWDEELPLLPVSPYGISRAAATQTALCLARAQALPVVVLRAFTVYGPSQPAAMFVAQAIESWSRGVPFVPRDGAHRQDLVFVADVVEALLLAAQAQGIEGQVFNIGTGKAPSLHFVAAQIRALCQGEKAISSDDSQPETAPRALWEQARKHLGWQPRTDLTQGLAQTLQTFRN